MTAQEFTTAVEVWTGAIVAASAIITPAALLLLKRINDVAEAARAMHAQNAARLDQHATAIKDAGISLVTTPPPSPITPADRVFTK